MVRVIINGSKGKMGQTLLACGESMPGIEVVGGVDVGDDISFHIKQADVVIDFSIHEATLPTAELCRQEKKGLIIGTTGHSDEVRRSIEACSQEIPMVWASNFSTGVNSLFWLVRQAARIMGPNFDLEVIEMHHRMKRDAPSGTAATLVEILREARGSDQTKLQHGREGIIGERPSDEIGVHSLRGGDVVGDHTVMFSGQGERLELTHKASSRETFANGALRAAMWVVNQPPGLYSMENVLGLKDIE